MQRCLQDVAMSDERPLGRVPSFHRMLFVHYDRLNLQLGALAHHVGNIKHRNNVLGKEIRDDGNRT